MKIHLAAVTAILGLHLIMVVVGDDVNAAPDAPATPGAPTAPVPSATPPKPGKPTTPSKGDGVKPASPAGKPTKPPAKPPGKPSSSPIKGNPNKSNKSPIKTTTTPAPQSSEPQEMPDLETPKLDINATSPVKCDPRDYVQRGYCQKYFTCNRKLRQEIKRGCSDGLFWNPSFNSIHGGVCDYLRNIENETLYEYKRDPTCVLDVAYFRAEAECSSKYYYNHPTRTNGTENVETCPKGLVWSKQKESCELCHMVKKADGTPCCSSAMDDDY